MSTRATLLPLSVALIAVVSGAAPSGLLVSSALASRAVLSGRPRDEETKEDPLLILAPSNAADPLLLAGHRSHRSHSSHSSHYSGSGWGGGWRGGGTSYVPVERVAPPKPPKPAQVSFAAYPGGRIFVDGKEVGHDITNTLRLPPGAHEVKIENRFLGSTTVSVTLSEGQTGPVVLEW